MLVSEALQSLQNLTKSKVSQADIARVLNVTPVSINKRIARASELKVSEAETLEKHYNVSLLTESNTSIDCISVTYRPDVYLSAGYGVDVLEERAETMLIDACLLTSEHGTRYNPELCEVVKISGNSMSPEYRHGDRVIINKGDTELMDGHIFAFRYKNQCFVKEINLMGNKVKCISLNKEYDPFYINEGEEFTVLGRILPRIRL